jgi:hypothetical protein
MGVPTSEVGYTSVTTGRGDHEVHKGHVVALETKKNSSCADMGVIAKITALYPTESNSTTAPHIKLFMLGLKQAFLSHFLLSIAHSMRAKKRGGF